MYYDSQGPRKDRSTSPAFSQDIVIRKLFADEGNSYQPKKKFHGLFIVMVYRFLSSYTRRIMGFVFIYYLL